MEPGNLLPAKITRAEIETTGIGDRLEVGIGPRLIQIRREVIGEEIWTVEGTCESSGSPHRPSMGGRSHISIIRGVSRGESAGCGGAGFASWICALTGIASSSNPAFASHAIEKTATLNAILKNQLPAQCQSLIQTSFASLQFVDLGILPKLLIQRSANLVSLGLLKFL